MRVRGLCGFRGFMINQEAGSSIVMNTFASFIKTRHTQPGSFHHWSSLKIRICRVCIVPL